MRRFKFEVEVEFSVPDNVELCEDDPDGYSCCQGNCDGYCDRYLFDRLKAYLNNDEKERRTELWSTRIERGEDDDWYNG